MTKTNSKMTRRRLVKASAGIGAGAALTGCAAKPDNAPWRNLTRDEGRLLELVCEQIIPTDRDPGAREAGAALYIDAQFSKRYKGQLERYRKGLAALQAACRQMHGRTFEEASAEQRIALLRAVESGKVDQQPWGEEKSGRFFAMLRGHTIEGVFSHPRHGGNRDLAGYRILGWEYPEPRGQNRYDDPRFRQFKQPG